jgi:lysyl-tRNA synthetase class 2
MSQLEQWRPTASLAALRARAELCHKVRAFFAARDVLEVETPLMCARGVTDPYIQAFAVDDKFLQTSPEYAMKRLLAAGYGSMFQICKVFRREEAGHLHNPEFTMLEWYRVGFTHIDLIDETDALLQEVLGCAAAQRISYHDLFMKFLNINPHTAGIEELQSCAAQHGIDLTAAAAKDLNVTDWLQLLMSHIIEPQLIGPTAWVVYNFPVAQAALAKILPGEFPVAARFEVYMQGIELANGYYELQNAAEQEKRFIADNATRRSQGLHEMQPDDRLVAALKVGLPDCAGIALGLDRLLMLKLQAESIAEVLSFTITNA